MARRDYDQPPAEDYIEQLQWQSRHHRRYWPVRYEPKWKYRIVYRYPAGTPLDRAIRIAIMAGVILLIGYILVSDKFFEQVGEKIFYGLAFGLILAILFFTLRDSSENNEDNN